MKFILGKKLEMTQKFKEDGTVVPATVISAGPCFITQVRSLDNDDYKAVQIGYQEAKKLNKPLTGHLKDSFKAKYLTEFRVEDKDGQEYKKGQQINVNVFEKGEKVKISGISKGQGFQGVVKRYGFHGAPASHGTKDQLRHPGSIGATGPAHVFKGTKMPGRMGGGKVTISNLEIVDIDPEKNLLFIKGAIPGSRNGLIEISSSGEMDLTKTELKKEQKKGKTTPRLEESQKEEEDRGDELKEEKIENKKETKTKEEQTDDKKMKKTEPEEKKEDKEEK